MNTTTQPSAVPANSKAEIHPFKMKGMRLLVSRTLPAQNQTVQVVGFFNIEDDEERNNLNETIANGCSKNANIEYILFTASQVIKPKVFIPKI